MYLQDEFFYKNSGVRVTAMCPGLTDTDLIQSAASRQMTPELNALMREDIGRPRQT